MYDDAIKAFIRELIITFLILLIFGILIGAVVAASVLME